MVEQDEVGYEFRLMAGSSKLGDSAYRLDKFGFRYGGAAPLTKIDASMIGKGKKPLFVINDGVTRVPKGHRVASEIVI